MSNFKDGCYSCTAGTELLAKVIAGKCQMHYTRAAVGCGKIPAGKIPEVMIEPADYVMDAMISNVSIPVDGQCQVTVQLNSKNVETAFLATCILLYAQDPDIGEVPYTYLVLENNPEWIKSADSDMAKLAVFDLITAVGSIENVSADIAPDAVITRAEVDDIVSRKVDKISGKGLSTEDFTTVEKNKLSGIADNAAAVSSSETNGNVKINGIETTVYIHPSGTNPHGTTKADVGLGNVGDFKAVSTAANQALTDSEQANARANIDAAQQSTTYSKSETEQLITQKVSEIVANSPEDFDTLKEISDWISGHENSAAAMNSAISANSSAISTKADKSNTYTKSDVDSALNNKVDKISGKSLSTEDFTTAEKNKLAGIASGAQINSITGVKGNAESSYRTGNVNITPENIGAAASSHTHTKSNITDFPASLPASDVYPWAKASTKPSYIASEVGAVAAKNIDVSGIGSLTSEPTFLGSFHSSSGRSGAINIRYDANTGIVIHTPLTNNSEGLYYSKQTASDGWVYSRMIVDSHNIGKFARSSKEMYTTKGTDGSNGWAEICNITVGGAYVNSPFRIMITQRGLKHPYFIDICFSSNSSPADTVVNYFTLSTGSPVKTGAQAYIIKTNGTKPVFRVYVKKTQAWDIINILDLNRPHTDGFADLSIGWGTGHLADVSGGIAATDIGTTT